MYRLGVGWESIVGGLYTLFGRWGCAWWGSDVGCWDNEKGKENGSKSNV